MAVNMIITVVALLLASFAFITFDYFRTKENIKQDVKSIADLFANNSVAALEFNDPDAGSEILSALQGNQRIYGAFIYDKSKILFAHYIDKQFDINKLNDQQSSLIKIYKSGNEIESSLLTDKEGTHIHNRFIFEQKDIIYDSEKLGTIFIISDLSEVFARLKNITIITLLIFGTCTIVALLLSFRLQSVISDPILKLSDIAKKISDSKDYSIRASSSNSDEIDALVNTFNEMLGQIQTRDSALQEIQKDLEDRILDRTKQLQESNLVLKDEIDIRLRTEDELKSSLHEKDILLKEVHHRVKNNLQVICSLLSLQSDSIEDESTLIKFEECKNRIMSMALVHELLYQEENFQSLDFNNYIKTLIDYLYDSFELEPGDIKFNLYIDNLKDVINISIDTVIPCGLILNELILNSLKHAFTGNGFSSANGSNKQKEITIRLYKESGNVVNLDFEDNGIGLPEGFDFTKSESLGLQLIVGLVKQIRGTINRVEQAGTAYNITFSIS
ncbi:MAG: HAMP domain-containing protein [Nitrosopumilaceae archaeon]|nr:HAMP domain-containing protein [Nitrosopumilaceae archaeon]